ncbi:MAG: DNA-binding MarR family transcriptional regulator [Planctomycetota bacterium]|jgi:DNA-binding MarR family transcriptional regulator
MAPTLHSRFQSTLKQAAPQRALDLSKDSNTTDDAPDFAGFDKLLEHRVRLALCVLLSRYEALSFKRLKELTTETDGGLGAHMRRLEDASYIDVKKEFVDRRPVTWYSLSKAGRKALALHVGSLRELLKRARIE